MFFSRRRALSFDRTLCCGRSIDRGERAHFQFQIERRLLAGGEIDFFGCGRKTKLGNFHAEVAFGKCGKLKFPVFIRPGDPRFSCGSLNDAQRRAGNGNAVRRPHRPGQLKIRGRIGVRVVLRRERNNRNCRQHEQSREQHCKSSTQQLSRPFEPLEDTVCPLPRFQYSRPGGRPLSSLLHPVHS